MTLQDIKADAMTIGYKGNLYHLSRLASKIADNPSKVYDYMAEYGIPGDSIIREKLFSYIADKYHNGNYAKVYDAWLA